MKDASHALNSGLVFSSSSRKCQVFKMIYCHAVRWGDRQLGKCLREDCGLGSGRALGSCQLWDHVRATWLPWVSGSTALKWRYVSDVSEKTL